MEPNIIMNNEIKYKLILIEHFPTVIVEMILSYMTKLNLHYVDNIARDQFDYFLVQGDNEFIRYGNELRDKHRTYKIPNNYTIKEFINTEQILVVNGYEYKILNIKNAQVINDLRFIGDNIEYCTFSDEYIVFRYINIQGAFIFNIVTNECVCNITTPCHITNESAVIDNEVFLTGYTNPIIFKYDISGKHINNIYFKNKIFGRTWDSYFVKIIKYEIILARGDSILFYNLDGLSLYVVIINVAIHVRPIITPNHIYITHDREIHKYKRVLR
jgi:hypothetical protein